jgi:hypothetical protein
VCTFSSACAWQRAVAFRIRTEVTESLAVDNIGQKLDRPVEFDTENDAYIGNDTQISGIKCKGSCTLY